MYNFHNFCSIIYFHFVSLQECLDEIQYRKLYRFSENNVFWLSDYFLGQSEETRGGALSPKQKTEVTLRCLSDPGFQEGVSYDAGISQSTVSKTISEVLHKIFSKMDEWILFPTTINEENEVIYILHIIFL